jgi:pyridoxal phosphate enzyme (YggS family)
MDITKLATPDEIRQNYRELKDRIETALQESGRGPGECRLIAVTKYVDVASVAVLAEAGCRDFGESRPQEIWKKSPAFETHIRWHLIGHLQRNKVRRTLPMVHCVHSVDSLRLLELIGSDSASLAQPLSWLLEINISGDNDKTGISETEGEMLLARWQTMAESYPQLSLAGLMGMARLEGGTEHARRDFEALRNLRDRWVGRFGISLPELSMGMSHDFVQAIQEGATMVRIGSSLFAPRET